MQALYSQLMSRAVRVKMKTTAVNLIQSTWSQVLQRRKNCAREALEQVPPSYKQIETTTRNGKRASIGSSLMSIFKEPFASFAVREELLFKEQEEHGFLSLSKTGSRQSRRWKLMQGVRFTSSRVKQRWLQLEQYKRDPLFNNSSKLWVKRS